MFQIKIEINCFRSGTKENDKGIEDLDNDRAGLRGYTGNKGGSEASWPV